MSILKPKSLLPWSITNETNELVDAGYYSIFGATHDDTATTDEVDGKYIVQACNNFPKAIELLKESKSFKRIADYEKWIKKVEEYLKSLEENGE
jgi:predicted nucleotide-binding protein (sugar kinase/HSP70/actin superfamily)